MTPRRLIQSNLRALALLTIHVYPASPAPPDKPRLLILTDIGGDPDDQQSLIRLQARDNGTPKLWAYRRAVITIGSPVLRGPGTNGSGARSASMPVVIEP